MTNFTQRNVTEPHFAIPLRFGGINGAAVVNQQDSDSDLTDCIKAIVAYPIGVREDDPGFGIPDIVFGELDDDTAHAIQAAIAHWEPRVDPTVSEVKTFMGQLSRYFRIEGKGREGA